MRTSDIAQYNLAQYRDRTVKNLQAFLNYKRTNTITFGHRLLNPFVVIGFVWPDEKSDSVLVNLQALPNDQLSDHYWVSKKEFIEFLNGKSTFGVQLKVDGKTLESEHIILEVSASKNNFTNVLDLAHKLVGTCISYNLKMYRCHDVQVKILGNNKTDDKLRVVVSETDSGIKHILDNIIVRNKIETRIGTGYSMSIEDSEIQEELVKKEVALKAIQIEKDAVIGDLRAWFLQCMSKDIPPHLNELFLERLREIV